MVFAFLLSLCPILLAHGQIISGTYTVSSSPVAGTITSSTQYKTRWLTKTSTTSTNSIIATFSSVIDGCPIGQYPAATVALVNNDYRDSNEYTTITDRSGSSSVNCLQTGGSDIAFSWANLRFCAKYAMQLSGGRYSISIEMRPATQVNAFGIAFAGSNYFMGAEITINCSSLTRSPTGNPVVGPPTTPSSTLVSTYTTSSTIGSTFIYSTTRYATRWLTDISITATFTNLNNRCPSSQSLRATIYIVDNDYSSSSEYTTIRINGVTTVRCLETGGRDRTFSWGNARSCRVHTLGSLFGSTYALTVAFTPTSSVNSYSATYNGRTYDMGAAIVIHCSGTTVNVVNSGIASSTPSPTFSYSSSTVATAAAVAVWTIIAIVCGSICFVCCIVGLLFYVCCAAAASATSRPATKVAAAPVVMAVSTTTTQSEMVTQGQLMTQPGIEQPYQTPQYNTVGGVPGPTGGNAEYASVQQLNEYVNQPLYAPATAGAPGDQMITQQPGGATAPGMNPGYVQYTPAGNAPPQYNAGMMNQPMDAPPGYNASVGAPPAYGGGPPAYGGGAPSYGQAPPVYGQPLVPQPGEGAATTGNANRGY